MKKAPIIYLKFWDHCTNSGTNYGALPCETIAWLINQDKKSLHLATWVANGVIDDNTEGFSILKSTIIEKKFIRK